MIVERFLAWLDQAPAEKKAAAADALARAFVGGSFAPEDMDAAEAALTALVDDPDDRVRAALASSLAPHAMAPPHIISALAADKPEIAMTILTRSPVFIDAELVEIIGMGSLAQQIAIACRPSLGASVSAAIAETGELEAAMALMINETASVSQEALQRIAERHGDHDQIQKLLACRGDLNPQTCLLLIQMASEKLREQLQVRPWMSSSQIDGLVSEQYEKAVIAYGAGLSQAELRILMTSMIEADRLSTAFLLRGVCMGNISLFAAALSILSDMPGNRVETILESSRSNAFAALYRQAGLPQSAYSVFWRALDAWREYLAEGGEGDPARMPRAITRKVLETYERSTDTKADNLWVLIRQIATETARDSARAELGRLSRLARERDRKLLAPPAEETVDIPVETLRQFAVHFAEEIAVLEDGGEIVPFAPDSAQESIAIEAETESVLSLLDEAFEKSLALELARPDVTPDIAPAVVARVANDSPNSAPPVRAPAGRLLVEGQTRAA